MIEVVQVLGGSLLVIIAAGLFGVLLDDRYERSRR